MINYLILTIPIIVSFITTLYTTKLWIARAKEIGLVGRDMNKQGDIKVAEAGGVWVMIGSAFGLLTLVAMETYVGKGYGHLNELFALTTLLLLSGFVGFLDDTLGWKRGIKPLYRVLVTIPISIPLVVIKAGYSKMNLPLIGTIDFGILYPLILVPIGVMGASNAFNMVAGYNGLESTQSILLSLFTALYAYVKKQEFVFDSALIMISAALAFLIYNKYPAKVFPGNSFTYGFGAFYASLVIIGDFQKFGLMLFTIYFIELILFIRGLLNGVYKENFGIPQPDGSLKPPYDKCYSITHLAIKFLVRIKGKATEKEVVELIAVLQIFIGLITFIMIDRI